MLAFHKMEIKDYLVDEFHRRLSKNSSYSMRAFARDLEMSPQKLHLVINGKSGLSSRAAQLLVSKLKISDFEKERFILLVESKHHRSQTARQIAQKKLLEHVDADEGLKISDDGFRITSEWYYLPILLMLEMNFDLRQSALIAKKLDIQVTKIKKAISDLVQAGLLIQKNDGSYTKNSSHFSYVAKNSSSDLMEYYKEYLHKAEASLLLQKELRHFSVMLTTISEQQIEFAVKEINQFRKKLGKILADKSASPDKLYSLSVQFFPVLKEGN